MRFALQEAQSRLSALEYAVIDARRCTVDDKLSAETRLVMIAVALRDIEQIADQASEAVAKAAAAARQAEPA